jgi:DNA-binding NtrC family response regulator
MAFTALSNEPVPPEGSVIEVDLSLPEPNSRLTAKSRVVWVDEREARAGYRRVTLGVSFEEMRPSDRAALQRYLADYRPRVVVVQPAPGELTICREVLEPDAWLHVAASEVDLSHLLGRGDIQVVVVFGDDESRANRAVDQVSGQPHTGRALTDLMRTDPVPRVVLCARASAQRVVGLHNQGKLYQSLPRPVEPHALKVAVQRAAEDYAVRSELRRVSLELERTFGPERAASRSRSLTPAPARLVVESSAMRAVLERVQVVSPHRAHVLLQGETGTGKELLARAIHDLSDRAQGPFVALDCGAVTETLLESELFGHVEGAFTGATSDRPGLFQMAEGGTLFLDEIENTTPALQAKLLRALDTGEVRPVGGSRVRRVDVRLVAASNRPLTAEAEVGRFRADLYYRLSAFPIDVPPLRQRQEDILPLARTFVASFGEVIGRSPGPFTPEAERALRSYRWPGNVRELRNAMERAVLLCAPGRPLDLALLPDPVAHCLEGSVAGAAVAEGAGSLRQRVQDYERQIIGAALERNGGVLRRAAKDLRTSPVTLGRKVKGYRLRVR